MIQEPQHLLETARTLVKQKLTILSQLDQQYELKQYQLSTLKLSLIETIQTKKPGNKNNKKSYEHLLQQINVLEEETKELAQKKVELSNRLYSCISNYCEQMEEFMANEY